MRKEDTVRPAEMRMIVFAVERSLCTDALLYPDMMSGKVYHNFHSHAIIALSFQSHTVLI